MLLVWIIYLQMNFIFILANFTSDAHGINQPVACRTERRMYLLYDQYKADTCARCYTYMPPYSFQIKLRYQGWDGILKHPITNETFEANHVNTSQGLLDSFADETFVYKWKVCCIEAINCCHRMIETPPPLDKDALYCPRTWDGWQCWDDTPAGTTAKQQCRPHIYFRIEPPSCTKLTYKICWPNGTWFLNEQLREWTNYSKCGKSDEHRRYLYFHIATYAISVVSIFPALIIFSVYKQLQVYRITMHKNLFFSLFLNAIVMLLFKSIVVLDEFNRSKTYETIMQKNGGLCKFLLILTKYFRMTNYMWMFCEGFYLHKLIAAAFAEQKNLIMFYVIGWVLPIIPLSIYAIIRKIEYNEKCWAFPADDYEWIMNAPNMLSLFVNFFFLCNIIRVLITKLCAANSNEPNHYRKAVRATLILIPLFGLQFLLVFYRPTSGHCVVLEIYKYFSHATDGLQGFVVALFFCYMNSEAMYEIQVRFGVTHLSVHYWNSELQPEHIIKIICSAFQYHATYSFLLDDFAPHMPFSREKENATQASIRIYQKTLNTFSVPTTKLEGPTWLREFVKLNKVVYLLKRTYQRFRLNYHFRPQASIMLNAVSGTQVSSMGDSQTGGHQGLHYRTKRGEKPADVLSFVPHTNANAQENTTVV